MSSPSGWIMLIISYGVPGIIVSSTAEPADVTLKTAPPPACSDLSDTPTHSPASCLNRSKPGESVLAGLCFSPALAARDAKANTPTIRLAVRINIDDLLGRFLCG